VEVLAISFVTGVSFSANELNERRSTQFVRQAPRCFFVQPHEGRIDYKAAFHSEVQRCLKRLQSIVATVRVAGEISLTHASNEASDASPVRDSASYRKKEDIAAGYERIWQTIRLDLNLDIAGKGSIAYFTQHAQIDNSIISETMHPIGKYVLQFFQYRGAAIELNSVPLSIVKSNGFDTPETRQRPS
jgi:hypothetical protein